MTTPPYPTIATTVSYAQFAIELCSVYHTGASDPTRPRNWSQVCLRCRETTEALIFAGHLRTMKDVADEVHDKVLSKLILEEYVAEGPTTGDEPRLYISPSS